MTNHQWTGPTRAVEGMHPELKELAERMSLWPSNSYWAACLESREGMQCYGWPENLKPNFYTVFTYQQWLQARKDLGLCTCPIDKTSVCARGLPDAMTMEEEELPAKEHQYSPYFKDVRHIDTLDVYRVIDLFGCEKHGHPISHAVKKLLLSGVRTGGKDVEKDVSEAIDSLQRWLEMREEDK